jgi:hypothetical protein
LPGRDPLYAVAAGLIFGTIAAIRGKGFAAFISPAIWTSLTLREWNCAATAFILSFVYRAFFTPVDA